MNLNLFFITLVVLFIYHSFLKYTYIAQIWINFQLPLSISRELNPFSTLTVDVLCTTPKWSFWRVNNVNNSASVVF